MKRKSRRVLTPQERKNIRQGRLKGRTWKSLCEQWAISQSTLARVLNDDYAKKSPALKPHKIQNRKPPIWFVTAYDRPDQTDSVEKIFNDLDEALAYLGKNPGATLWEAEKCEVELTARLVK